MTDDNLTEFLEGRVLPTRQVHHVQYPLDLPTPNLGVMLDCPQDAMTVVILPTFIAGVVHLEMHFFADGLRVSPAVTIPVETDGCIECTLHKPTISATM